ncbi:hypothetical protein M8C21_024808 [Ambrosia artemisiifolia]|uniref:AGC-kinase C-terminal domain-containing protein n=1 Tax=Ambrosia artemisiifolia TaxID=4212 RepID=A0AAD5D6L5_AMBAR|nr:hypothetical protein M8C21_024808 [Ambrosia artemisiifolia]
MVRDKLKLLQKDPSKRLGNGSMGSHEIKHHKWFKPINWKRLDAREIQPTFRPEVAGNQCITNFDKRWTDMPLLDSPASRPNTSANLFQGIYLCQACSLFLMRNSPLIMVVGIIKSMSLLATPTTCPLTQGIETLLP